MLIFADGTFAVIHVNESAAAGYLKFSANPMSKAKLRQAQEQAAQLTMAEKKMAEVERMEEKIAMQEKMAKEEKTAQEKKMAKEGECAVVAPVTACETLVTSFDEGGISSTRWCKRRAGPRVRSRRKTGKWSDTR